jgi:hypothetical protein
MAKTPKSANLFSTAQTLEVAAKPKKGGKVKAKAEIEGLEDFATVTTLLKNLETIQKTMEGPIKEKMKEVFLAQNSTYPESFEGTEGSASASCECRKRTTKSVLKEDEVEELEEDGIEVGSEEIVPERFIINPAHAQNKALLQKVSDALKGVPGLPEDFIVLQAAQVNRIVSDVTFREVCEAGLLEKHFSKIATLAIKPKLEKEIDIKAVISKVKELV